MRILRSTLSLLALSFAVLCQVAPAQEFNIFGLTNKVWKYDSTNDWYTPTGLGWTTPSFDDSAWPSGRAILTSDGNATIVALRGQQIRDMRPVLAGVPGATANQACYFRARFNWPSNASPSASLRMTVRVDDGVAVYLNGNRVGGLRMGNPVAHNSFTAGAALVPCVDPSGNNDGTCDEIIMIDGTHLVNGENVLAVTVHQNNATSSDMTWGCRLDGLLPSPPVIVDDTQPTNRVILQSRRTTLSVVANAFPAPTYQWFLNNSPIDPLINPTATNANYVIARMAESDAGEYYCQVSNPIGSVPSRIATVGYIADTVAPTLLRVVGSPTFDRLTVEYNEGMDSLTATDAVNYALSPPLTVLSAVMAPNGSSIILTTDPQAPNTVYTLSANDVYDLAGNVLPSPGNTADFRSWVSSPGCSGVLFEAFASTATTIATFTNTANFPNNPFRSIFINRMHSRAAHPDNSNDNYGGRMRALFIPLVSGDWRFYMSSDDPGHLFINPNGTSPDGRILVARENGCCNLYQAPGALQTSPAFPMIAGQAYYIELIYKENAGGDYGMVAARLDGTGTPTGGNDQGAEAGEAISGAVLPSPFCTVAAGAIPSGAAGTLSIVQDLSNVSAQANTRVTLTAGVSAPASPFVCYQWQKSDDGGMTFADISGATRPSYTTPYLTEADDHNDVYRLVASIPGAQVTSANAVLSVTADTTLPRVVRVVSVSASQIAVIYSEPMIASSSATDPFGYEIDGGAIIVAECITNINTPSRIDLVISPTTPVTLGNLYQLRISTDSTLVTDFAGNSLDPTPTLVTFRSITYSGNPETLRALPTDTLRPIGSLTARGLAGRMVRISANFSPPLMPITEQVLAGTVINPVTGQPYPNIAPQPTFIETSTINYGDAPAGAGTGRLLPDRAFPGFTNAADNMAMEVLAYLELSRGIYRMGVNSDDDFRVTPARGISDPNNSMVLGEFSGGRGPTDSLFDFEVTQDGLYPFRLIWSEYQGGATCEWWIQSLVDSSYIGVNGSDAIKAFLPPQPRVNVARAGGATSVSWVDAVTLQDAPAITGPWIDSANQVNPQVVEVYGASLDGAQDGGGTRTGTGTASVLLSGNQVTINVTYSGLSGTVGMAHIHSPAPRGSNAGILYHLTPVPVGGQAGTISQTITLVDKAPPFGTVAEQITQLRSGLWYINIHTSTFGGGEIRGQIESGGMRFFRARE